MTLRIHLFAHSLVSDWSHGSAHFLRGLARSLMQMGHRVRCHEELGSWSLLNLVRNEQERSIDAIDQFRQQFRELDIHFYERQASLREYLKSELRHADAVLIHEWNAPETVNAILALKEELGFRAFLLDNHHRAYTRAGEMLKFHLHLFDGILAGGEALRRIYADGFGLRNVWTFHEAADVDHFVPHPASRRDHLVWIGNWGEQERTSELDEFLVQSAYHLSEQKFAAYGVRYPEEAIEWMRDAGIDFRGYLPNLEVPEVYSRSALALNLPRKQFANGLSGIPAPRMFQALACGVAVVSGPWQDSEGLFRREDFVRCETGVAMRNEIQSLLQDDKARRQIAANGLETVRRRHTCRHRAELLTEILHTRRARAA